MAEQQRYTLNDLAEAESRLADAERRVDNYDGNNPNRGRADLRRARDMLTIITLQLQAQGDLPKPEPTEQQKLERALDARYPNARSKEIVEHEGQRYQLRFAPARKSNSGKTVMEWSRWWEKVGGHE